MSDEKKTTSDYFGGADLVQLFERASKILSESASRLEELAADPQFVNSSAFLAALASEQRSIVVILDVLITLTKRTADYVNLLVKGYMLLSEALEDLNKKLPDELKVAKLIEEISKGEAGGGDAKTLLDTLKNMLEGHKERLEQDLRDGRIA